MIPNVATEPMGLPVSRTARAPPGKMARPSSIACFFSISARTKRRAGSGCVSPNRTLKENLLWVRSVETIEALHLALLEFQRTYNEQWMLAKHDYRSPAQVRRDFDGLGAVA